MTIQASQNRFTNCHVHTFTHDHTPDRFVPPPLNYLLRLGRLRRAVLIIIHRFFPQHASALERYAEILETSYRKNQQQVFEKVQGFYPEGTRFVVLPMDMELMGLGKVKKSIADQHAELARLQIAYPDTVIPFAAVDPRHTGIVATTEELLENGFRGIKLYPPIGYHPFDRRLWPLYEYAQERKIPVLTHCSRPASVQFQGKPTPEMEIDPKTERPVTPPLDRLALLTWFTDPDSYRDLLTQYPKLRVCLAHFGGAGDWGRYLNRPWDSGSPAVEKSWLSKVADMIRSGDYPNLWTDISFTVFADDEYVYLLETLLSDPRIRDRVLFGSDFYVVEDARLEERHRSVRIRAVLGEPLFKTIAVDNPREFLGF